MSEHDIAVTPAKSKTAGHVDHDHNPGKSSGVGQRDDHQVGWNGKAYRGTAFSGATLPWSSPKGGIEVLAGFAANAEAKVRTLSAKRLDSVLAPDAVIATVATSLADEFEQLDPRLANADIEATEATALLGRIDHALGTLYTLARQHRVPMRESGLERVFDGEDSLRLRFSYPRGRANRAEMYYDDNLEAGGQKHGAAPDASTVAADLTGDTDTLGSTQPGTRDTLIGEIESLGMAISEAIKLGYEEAQQKIVEPSAPRQPELLVELAQLAATLILGYASSALGSSLGAIAKVIDKRIGASFRVGKYATRQVGASMARSLLTGFRTAGAAAASGTAAIAVRRASASAQASTLERDPPDEKLSARTIYLKAARGSTVDKAVGIQTQFHKYVPELKRLPVETLQAVADAFDRDRIQEIKKKFSALIVREWVNFGKRATDHGEEVRDDVHRPAHPSRLDNLVAPYGVVRIVMVIDDHSRVAFQRAELPGVSDAVLASIRDEVSPLATMPIYRRVELRSSGEHLVDPGGFEVDDRGGISFGHMSDEGRLAFAKLANPAFGRTSARRFKPSDADVLAGMRYLLEQLSASSLHVKAAR